MKRYMRIVGLGKHMPARIWTNHDLEKWANTSDEWILTRTGIGQRHAAQDHETVSSLGLEAARDALTMAELDPAEIDLVICATISSEMHFPSSASIVQGALGANRAGAFDINAGSTGFVYGLSIANQFITSGTYKNILCIGAETLTRALDWRDQNVAVLFGDGAGAAVLQASDQPTGSLSFVLGSDGSMGDILSMPSFWGRPADDPTSGRPRVAMNGPAVFKFAVSVMVNAARQVIDAAGLTIDDIDLFVPHQSNLRIIRAATKYLGISSDKVFVNLKDYGNTSAASVPIALCDAYEKGRIKDGDKVVLVAYGAGLTWAAMVLNWGVGKPTAAEGSVPSASLG